MSVVVAQRRLSVNEPVLGSTPIREKLIMFIHYALATTQSVALISTTHHKMFQKLGENWKTECLTKFLLPIVLYAECIVKLK